MEHLILVFRTNLTRKEVYIDNPTIFLRIKNALDRRGILTTNVFFGNEHPESIAVFPKDDPEKILQQIAELQH